jgi:hypothetical protein
MLGDPVQMAFAGHGAGGGPFNRERPEFSANFKALGNKGDSHLWSRPAVAKYALARTGQPAATGS